MEAPRVMLVDHYLENVQYMSIVVNTEEFESFYTCSLVLVVHSEEVRHVYTFIGRDCQYILMSK